jgi:hypothetical protein
MSLDLMTFEQDLSPNGQRHVWLAPNVVDRLRAMRGPGESYSDLIPAIGVSGLPTCPDQGAASRERDSRPLQPEARTKAKFTT